MSPEEIRSRVARLDARNPSDTDAAWSELRALKEAMVPYLLDAYRSAKRSE